MATDHRVKGACAGGRGQVNTHLVDGWCLGMLGIALMRRTRLTEDLDGLRAHFFQVDAQAFKHASGNAFAFADEAEQEMFCPDIAVIEEASLMSLDWEKRLAVARSLAVAAPGPG